MNENLLEKVLKLTDGPKGVITSVVSFILSSRNRSLINTLHNIALQIDTQRPLMLTLTDAELRNKTDLFKQKIAEGATPDSILVDAFAVARESARRILGEEPYIVQMMGGIAMHRGMIAEMKTGEGKTLSAILPAYLNALTGKGVHIVTVNDYLAKRDADWMGQLFEFLGLKTGYIIGQMSQNDKLEAYLADITYCSNSELGFDFLRDNMANSIWECAQRELNYCIVDEADSVLIDEAKTPLIISGPTTGIAGEYHRANTVVTRLQPEHYNINLKENQAHFTDSGLDEVKNILAELEYLKNEDSLYDPTNSVLLHQLNQALRANHLFKVGIDYLVKSDNDGFGGNPRPSIKLIDTNTGRILDGRRYSDGLHQALEAKENVPIRGESETLASITFQQLFRLYNKLSGMTGTASTESEEFETTYRLSCIEIPTNVPKRRIDHEDSIFLRKIDKMRAIIEQVDQCHSKGQPIIVGTTSVESSEEIADYLTHAGFAVNVLNAKNHAREADIIANAGRLGSITVVTNMAGRGTDIKLGGDPKILLKRKTAGWEDELSIARESDIITDDVSKNKAQVIQAGGLYILGAEHNNSRRIDDQLRGRAGRQGDPGETRFFESTDGELFKKFNPNMTNTLIQFGAKDDEALEHPWLTGAINNAQQRMEAYNFESRQSMQKYSDIKENYIMKFYKKRRKVLESTLLMQEVIMIFHKISSDTQDLIELGKICQYTGDDLKKWATESFYTSIENYKQKHQDNLNDEIRAHFLYSIDENIKRYMLIMSNEKDIVALHSYSQKDPIMAYYRIARVKYEMTCKVIDIDIIGSIILDSIAFKDNINEEQLELALERIKLQLEELQIMQDAFGEKVSDDDLLVEDNSTATTTNNITPEDSMKVENNNINNSVDQQLELNTGNNNIQTTGAEQSHSALQADVLSSTFPSSTVENTTDTNVDASTNLATQEVTQNAGNKPLDSNSSNPESTTNSSSNNE